MAESLDFQINDLKFRAAISDKFPYARATAPFRKEQFDSAPTVGDQSLAGWWTRGQLSFHKGAGLKYYEVLAGDEILDRYTNSLGVDVSTPGEVALGPELSPLGVAASKAVAGTLSGSVGVFALTTSGVVFRDGSASTTAMATSDGGVPTDIASDGRYYYVCNGSRIERQSSVVFGRTNHVANPSFELDTAGWAAGSGYTIARVTTAAKYGTASLEIDSTGALTTQAAYALNGLEVGKVYRVSAWVRTSASDYRPWVGLNDSEAPPIRGAAAIPTDTWVKVSRDVRAIATTDTLLVRDVGVGNIQVLVDGVMVTESPFEGDYFDGDTGGGTWSGAAHASKSTFASSAIASSNILWLHERADAQWRGVWWGKGRLWAVDDIGRWYALAATGGDVVQDDAFWASGIPEGPWGLAEGAGAVYISNGSDIYAVGLDDTGGVPSLTAPPVAATVPANETISFLDYYLGQLVICTDSGVRVGMTSQNGEVVYGPIVIKGDFSSTNGAAKRDSHIYLTGQPEQHATATLCALDLGVEIADLLPSWFPYLGVGSTTSTVSGAAFAADNTLYAWAAGDLHGPTGNLAPSGWLETGYHRFGTLELKHFSGVKVRLGGTGGVVKVYSRLPQTADTLLATIDVASTQGVDVSLVMDGPVEAVGLKFVLERDALDATNGPEVLGYQLKALPSPRRQRLIQWPVVATDAVRDRYGVERGRRGSAWEAWTTLETLEQDDALVTYTDHRTGETGEAFIENIELQSDTPSQGATSGFGGVGMITLRKVG